MTALLGVLLGRRLLASGAQERVDPSHHGDQVEEAIVNVPSFPWTQGRRRLRPAPTALHQEAEYSDELQVSFGVCPQDHGRVADTR